MTIKSLSRLLLLLLVTAATAFGADDEWSWAVEAKESSILPEHEVLEEAILASPSSRDVFSEGGPVVVPLTFDAAEDETRVYEVLPLATEGETLTLESLPLASEPLPLEPHAVPAGGSGVATFSVSGEGELVDGLVVAEGGDREGRFLGLGDKLCSFGIGINCNNKKSQYAPPKVGVPQGSYGPPSPIKTHYSAPKPTVPQGSYGLPLPHPPKPPVLPNRDYNVAPPTKAPFSPINGLLSVLKPFMPTLKPKAPPKVSKGRPLTPSYTAPNPNYAPLLPSYTPPVKATYAAPTPSYSAPPSAYSPPKPAYNAPRPSYAAPQVHAAHSKPAFIAPRPSYAAPAVHVAHSKPAYVAPKPAYSAPKPTYDVQTSYSAPKRVYVEPKPVYANAVPTVTVHAHPQVVEQHHHTHTHLYNDKTVHHDIYKDDHNGVLQSVHDSINQINQHTLHREDVVGISTQASSHDTVQIAQPSINQVVVQQQIPATSPSPSVVPAVLVGGTNFRPGRVESGFQPSQAVLEPLFRPRRPTYREDCQCVPVGFCSAQDVIARNAPADLSNVIDARTRGSSILSNATDAEDYDTGSIENEEFTTDSPAGQGSARRGKAFDFSKVSEEVTEETTEEVTEAVTEYFLNYDEPTTDISLDYDEAATEAPIEVTTVEEDKTRRRREVNATSEEEQENEEDPALYSDRQGRQLKGFTPNGNGCGSNYVCCRRPVFRARQQQFTCGQRSAAGLLGRVKTAHFVQGDAEFGEYPWQAAVLKSEGGDILYQCGGTLIDNRHVLTAAHCVEGIHPSQLKVRLGEWDVSGQTEFYNHVEMRASGVYLHPEFYAGNLNNDIAVIRLEHFLDFSSNPHISPVCLPEKNADFTHQRCHATGWGKDAFGSEGKFSQVLKEVEVPVFERQHCQQTLQGTRLGPSFTLHEGNFCAGGEENKDTCKGDGGGPLVCSGPNGGGMQLAGLVSWGIGCGSSGVPGVYVKVSHYIDWIKDISRF